MDTSFSYFKKSIAHALVLYFSFFVPLYSLAGFISLAEYMGDTSIDCQATYLSLVKYLLIGTLAAIALFDAKFGKENVPYRGVLFLALNALIFASVNYVAFVYMFMDDLCSDKVDGQFILGVWYSALWSILVVIANGLVLDRLKKNRTNPEPEWEEFKPQSKRES